MSAEDILIVEEILKDAESYGLRWEVEYTAKKYIKDGHDTIESYVFAYEDWIK